MKQVSEEILLAIQQLFHEVIKGRAAIGVTLLGYFSGIVLGAQGFAESLSSDPWTLKWWFDLSFIASLFGTTLGLTSFYIFVFVNPQFKPQFKLWLATSDMMLISCLVCGLGIFAAFPWGVMIADVVGVFFEQTFEANFITSIMIGQFLGGLLGVLGNTVLMLTLKRSLRWLALARLGIWVGYPIMGFLLPPVLGLPVINFFFRLGLLPLQHLNPVIIKIIGIIIYLTGWLLGLGVGTVLIWRKVPLGKASAPLVIGVVVIVLRLRL